MCIKIYSSAHMLLWIKMKTKMYFCDVSTLQVPAGRMYLLLKEKGDLQNYEWKLALSIQGCSCTPGDGSQICCHGDSCIYAMSERHRQFWYLSSWLVEEGRCDSADGLSLWLMTSSAAAGWRWAVGWVPWQPASNPVARASGPGMHMESLS